MNCGTATEMLFYRNISKKGEHGARPQCSLVLPFHQFIKNREVCRKCFSYTARV